MKKIILLLSIVVMSIILSACSSNQPNELDNLAQCLTESGAAMYGTEWCPHCQDQKDMFGSSFKLVSYVDCDTDKQICVDAGIRGFPTWVINKEHFEGAQSLYILAKKSNCTLSAPPK